MKAFLFSLAIIACAGSASAQDWFSTDGHPRKRRPTAGRMAARIIVYLDTAEVPAGVKRAGLIIINDTRKREKAFEQAKDVAAAYRLEAICLRQERVEPQQQPRGRGRNAVIINNAPNGQNPAHQDSWVFWGYDLPEEQEGQ